MTPAVRIAGLPMYDFPHLRQAHDAFWKAVSTRLRAAGFEDVPSRLTRGRNHFELWRDSRLLFGQGCEYPLATSLEGRVRLVATPCYSAPGCERAQYRSAIVVRADDPAARVADMRHRHCAINESTSNSGLNLLRAAVAPLSNGEPFFATVSVSGSHRASALMVADGRADVAAIDCVSLAHLGVCAPSTITRLRVLSWTEPSPSPPFITARSTDDLTIRALRGALLDLFTDPQLSAAREQLLLEGIDLQPDETFARVRILEQRAAQLAFSSVN